MLGRIGANSCTRSAATGCRVAPATAPNANDAPVQPAAFEQQVAWFTKVQVRSEQTSFLEAVLRACEGRCVISGCAVPESSGAVHLMDQDWRQGYNLASNEIFLRTGLHTLYDRGLLQRSEAGKWELSDDILDYYGEFAVATGAPRS